MQKQCLKCDYIRVSTDTSPDYECPKCGAIYAKVEALLKDSKQKEKAARFVNPKQTVPTKEAANGKLTACRTCGKDVSRTAKTCPHCGESKPVPASNRTLTLVIGFVALMWIVGKFSSPGTKTVDTSCPPLDDTTLWLPADKEFAKQKFIAKAQRLNASGQCVLEGSFGQGYQKFYITVSSTQNVRDAQILRFSLEELDN